MKSLLLKIRDCGHIVSFKNTKMLSRGRLITAPDKQKAMDKYTRAIESGLRFAFQTIAEGTPTGHSLPSWIRSGMPLDDSVQWIPSISIEVVRVPKGEEGADIEVTQLGSGLL